MKIELKKIYHSSQLSEETEAFTANLYINGVNVGMAKNEGRGGPTDYRSYDKKGLELIAEAEKFCLALPPKEYPASEGMDAFSIPMNLEHYIDDILFTHIQMKEVAKFKKSLDKAMLEGIVFGIQDDYFATIKFNVPLAKVLAHPKGEEAIIKAIAEKVMPKLEKGMVLNNNIPYDLLKKAGLSENQFIKAEKTDQHQVPTADNIKGRAR